MNEKWTNYKGSVKLVNPANKRKLEVIVVGTGLAGASAAASLGEMGYKAFRTVRDVLIPLLLRVVSTLPKTTRTMAIAYTVFSMTP